MNHRERMQKAIAGEKLDRPPVALWRHFPVDDQSPETLAEAVINFQKTYDFDIVKVTPASSYFVKDWGLGDEWVGSTEGTRKYVKRIITEPEDWTKLPSLDPRKGQLAKEIEALKTIVETLGPDVPVIETIFSPIGQANKMAGQETLLYHLRRYPDTLKEGLQTIAKYTQDFVEATKETGIAGLFYAVQWGQYGMLSEKEFKTFSRVYDLEILQGIDGFWLNLLHLHGNNVMFDLVTDYPVEIINWHDLETKPSLPEGKQRFEGIVCGGIRQWDTLTYGSPDDVRAEANAAIQATGGDRFVLGTGCVTPTIAPHGNIMAARRAVDA
ncbi:MAG: hypothetical protein JXB38_12795 [Anaerolineales bacterium]|nr:hypothetical protein [Anaerolineales bacterium]